MTTPCTLQPGFQYTTYPCGIDSSDQLPITVDNQTPVKAEVVNRHREAIIAVESELGVSPSGTFTTVRARLDALDSLIAALSGGGSTISVKQNGTTIVGTATAINFIGGAVSVVQNGSQADVTITGGGGGASSAVQESFTASASQTSFTLSNTPTDATTVMMYVNGVKQDYGTDYTASGTSVTYIGSTIGAGWIVEFWYLYGGSSPTAAYYQTIQDASGTPLPQQGIVQFTGAGVASVVDDAGNSRTVITLSGGGGGGETLNETLAIGNIAGHFIVFEDGFGLNGTDAPTNTDKGGDISIFPGIGGSVSGNGGSLYVDTGDSVGGTGGAFTVGTGDGLTGGNIQLTLGSGSGVHGGEFLVYTGGGNAGGNVNFAIGDGSSGDGGDFLVTAGDSTSGDGGDVSLEAGSGITGGEITLETGSGSNGSGGNFQITLGDAGTSGSGGSFSVVAGDGISSNGGNITLSAGDVSTSGTAGVVTISAGDALSGNSAGGDITVASGAGFGNGVGGALTLTAGASGSGGGFPDGGDLTLTAGLGAGGGGNVAITSGATTAGNTGTVIISTPAGSVSNSGLIEIKTGAGGSSGGSQYSGTLALMTGPYTDVAGRIGDIVIETGQTSYNQGNTGRIGLKTNNVATGVSGEIMLTTNSGSRSGAIGLLTGQGGIIGDITISTGAPSINVPTTNTGRVYISTVSAPGGLAGGDFVVATGSGGGGAGNGGHITFTTGAGGAGLGGDFDVRAGAGGGQSGGSIRLRAGSSTTADGGVVEILAGNSSNASYAGGSVSLYAGNGTANNAPGGNLSLRSGSAHGSGLAGNIAIELQSGSLTSGKGELVINNYATAGTIKIGATAYSSGIYMYPGVSRDFYLNMESTRTFGIYKDNTNALFKVTERSNLGDGYVSGDFEVMGKLTVHGLIDPTGLVLTEQSVKPVAGTSTTGVVWVHNDGYLVFTDQNNTDNVLGGAGTPTSPTGGSVTSGGGTRDWSLPAATNGKTTTVDVQITTRVGSAPGTRDIYRGVLTYYRDTTTGIISFAPSALFSNPNYGVTASESSNIVTVRLTNSSGSTITNAECKFIRWEDTSP